MYRVANAPQLFRSCPRLSPSAFTRVGDHGFCFGAGLRRAAHGPENSIEQDRTGHCTNTSLLRPNKTQLIFAQQMSVVLPLVSRFIEVRSTAALAH